MTAPGGKFFIQDKLTTVAAHHESFEKVDKTIVRNKRSGRELILFISYGKRNGNTPQVLSNRLLARLRLIPA